MNEARNPRTGHVWRFRAETFRTLLITHRWGLMGAYGRKSIHGREVVSWIVQSDEQFILAKFKFRSDMEAAAEANAREGPNRPLDIGIGRFIMPDGTVVDNRPEFRKDGIPMSEIDWWIAKTAGFL